MTGITRDFLDAVGRDEAAAGVPREPVQGIDARFKEATGGQEPPQVSATPLPPPPDDEGLKDLFEEPGGKEEFWYLYKQNKTKDRSRSSRILDMQGRTGLPADLIQRNLEKIESASARSDFDPDDFYVSSPIVREWAKKRPLRVPVAGQKDLANLSYIERIWGNFKAKGRIGELQDELADIGESKLFGRVTPREIRRQDEIQQQLAAIPDYGISNYLFQVPGVMAEQYHNIKRTIVGSAKGAAAGAGTALVAGQLGPQVGLPEELITVPTAAVVGARLGGALAAGRIEAAHAYLEYENITDKNGNSLPHHQVAGAAAVVGVVNGAMEMVGLESFVKLPLGLKGLSRAGVTRLLKNTGRAGQLMEVMGGIGVAMGTEGATEFLQEAVTVAGKELLSMQAEGVLAGASSEEIVARIFSEENLSQLKEAGKAGTQAGLGFGAGGRVIRGGGQAMMRWRAKQAKRTEEGLIETSDAIKEVEMRKTNPGEIREVTDNVGKGQTFYIDHGKWDEYWNGKGIDPSAAAEQYLGNVDGYNDALETGVDIVVPGPVWLDKIAPSEHANALAAITRDNPSAMTGQEADEILTAIEKEAEETPPPVPETVEPPPVPEAATTEEAPPPPIEKAPETEVVEPPPLPPVVVTRDPIPEGQPPFLEEALPPPETSAAVEANEIRAAAQQQLEEIGVATETAAAQSEIVRHGFLSFAQRIGISPQQLFERMPFVIREQQTKKGFTAQKQRLRGTAKGYGRAGDIQATFKRIAKHDYEARLRKWDIPLSPVSLPVEVPMAQRLQPQKPRIPRGAPYSPERTVPDEMLNTFVLRRDDWISFFGGKAAGAFDAYKKYTQGWEGFETDGLVERHWSASSAMNRLYLPMDALQQLAKDSPEVFEKLQSKAVPEQQPRRPAPEEKYKDGSAFEAWGLRNTAVLEARGSIVFGFPAAVQLRKDAPAKTFLHEMSHFYFEMMATFRNESEAIDNDIKIVEKWLGSKITGKRPNSKQHEQFAHAYEEYLLEGKSPNDKLKNVFKRFQEFMLAFYRTIRDIGGPARPKLTDEIRGVFDRMLAAEDQVQGHWFNRETPTVAEVDTSVQGQAPSPVVEGEAKTIGEWVKELNLKPGQPLQQYDVELGVPPESQGKIQDALNKARAAAVNKAWERAKQKLQKERNQEWKKALKSAKERLQKELSQRQEYIALAGLQGKGLPEGVEAVKIDKKQLFQQFPKEVIDNIPRPFVYTLKGGVAPDDAAVMFGYRNAGEMIDKLSELRPLKEEVEARAEAEVREKLGEPVELTQEEILNYIHNDGRAALMREELRYLAREHLPQHKAIGKYVAKLVNLTRFMKDRAYSQMLDKRVGEVRPNVFLSAEVRHGRKANMYHWQGNFKQAFEHKQKQYLNHHLFKAAQKTVGSIRRIDKLVKRLKKPAARKAIGLGGEQYMSQIDALMQRFGFAEQAQIEGRTPLAVWAHEQAEKGMELVIPEWILDEGFSASAEELTVQQLLELGQTLQTLSHVGRGLGKFITEEKRETLVEAALQISGSINAHHEGKKVKPPEFIRDKKHFLKRSIPMFFASMLKAEFMIKYLDGNKDNGAAWQRLFKPFVEAERKEAVYMEKFSKALEILEKEYTKEERTAWFTEKIYVEEVGQYMSKPNILVAALNSGNAHNKTAWLEGWGWTEEQLQSVLNRLDERDLRVVQSIFDFLDNEVWPHVKEMEERLRGVAPEKVRGEPIVTNAGTIRGGYWPLVFETGGLAEGFAPLEDAGQVQELFSRGHTWPMTARGHTKERNNSAGRRPTPFLSVLPGHLAQVAHDLAYREPIINTHRLLNWGPTAQEIEAVIGEAGKKQLNDWIKTMANDNKSGPLTAPEKVLSKLRAGATIVNMGWKLSTAIVQPLGWVVSAHELGFKWAGAGLTSLKNPRESFQWMAARSKMMAGRMKSYDRDVRELLNKAKVPGAQFGKAALAGEKLKNLRESYFMFISWADMLVAMPTWYGAYQKALTGAVENIKAGDEQSAIDFADSKVRDTQGSGLARDLSKVQTQNELMKLFTMFYSYFNVLYNQYAKTFWNDGLLTAEGASVMKRAGNFASAAFLLTIIPALLEDILFQRAPEDEEDIPKWMLMKMMGYPMQSIVLVREFAADSDKFGASPPALFDVGRNMYTLWSSGVGGLADLAQGELPEIKERDVRAAFFTGGYVVGYPARQVWMTLNYFWEWLGSGEQNPEHIGEILGRGFVTPKYKNRRQ